MSFRVTATKNLARWLELLLKPYARLPEAYIKDTKSFLLHLEELNDTRAPFKESTKLLSWDIKNYYSNCSTELCMRAVKRILDERGTNLSQNSKKCILKSLSITIKSTYLFQCLLIMGSFVGSYLLKLMVQLLRSRIRKCYRHFGAVYIAEVSRKGDENLQPSDWHRYKDDTWDIEEDCDDENAKRFTDHLNKYIIRSNLR